MKKLALTALCAICFSSANATVESWDPDTGSGTIGPGGCVGRAFLESYNLALSSNLYACDWSEHKSDNEPGCAYKESQAASEDADCHEDHQNEDQA